MAAPHVSGDRGARDRVRRARRASRRPAAIEAWLKATARDLGPPGADDAYGAGLVDARAATTPPA